MTILTREQEMAEVGMAMGLRAAGMFGFRQPSEKSLAHLAWRKYALSLMPSHSSWKPEQVFARMIRSGSAILVRRRGKPPLLKRVIAKA